jgi:tol-pal system protein YbgF
MRVALLSLFVFVSACFYPADRGRMLETRVESLATDNKKLKSDLSDATEKLEDTTGKLKEALEQLDKASRSTGANMGVKVDNSIQDIAMLKGQLESQQAKVAELEQKLNERPAATVAAVPVEPKKEEPKKPEEPKEFFQLASDKLKAGESESARKLFNEFVKKWPKDENAGEAHYSLGETYFADSKCREALYEYGRVIQDHAKTKSAPLAYLHSADCFKNLKMIDEAKLALNELIKLHGKSESAKTAKTKLAELNKLKK